MIGKSLSHFKVIKRLGKGEWARSILPSALLAEAIPMYRELGMPGRRELAESLLPPEMGNRAPDQQ